MDNQIYKEKSDKLPEFKWSHFWWFVIIAGLLIISIFGFYFFNFQGEVSNNQNIWGVFGDFIGGTLSPLLAFMGLIALLYTIIIQSTELKETRKELSNSSKALKAQSESLALQNFETTFFNILSFNNSQILNTKIFKSKNSRRPLSGYDSFQFIHKLIGETVEETLCAEPNFENRITGTYEILIHMYKNQLDHFKNQVLNIFDLIIKSDIFNNPKYKQADYLDIIKRQYTHHQLVLIYLYFCNNSHPEYVYILDKTEFFHSIEGDDIPGLYNHLRKKYGSRSKDGLMKLIRDFNDERFEKCK